MNKVFIIGNLTRDPELHTTTAGLSVCSFTVGVNRKRQKDTTDFFRASAWGELGSVCHKYLAKGRKVAVEGEVRLNTYTGKDGKERASLEVLADNVEFLSPKEGGDKPAVSIPEGYDQVYEEPLPF